MDCASLISTAPLTLATGASLADAAQALTGARSEALAVIEADGRYCGMFSLDDLLALVVPRVALAGDMKANLRFIAEDPGALQEKFHAIKDRRIGDWCNSAAVTVSADAPAIEALRLFCHGHRVIPVLAPGSGRLLGTLTAADAIRAIIG